MAFRCLGDFCAALPRQSRLNDKVRRNVVFVSWAIGLLVAAPAWAQKSPEEQLQALRAPVGTELALYASEPLISNPAAIDIDTHGRVWVAEIQWYRAKAKQPPADKIKVLEDTDGDGRADKVTVFADGVFAPMSICVAGEKVYVATSPDLWVYEDKNGDLVADGPPQKLLTGFGGFNHDHGAHSLVLGPDHKWWMAHGDTGFKVTGTDGSKIEFRWGAMLRGELDGSQLEQIAVNFRNPYEIAVSSFGESFCSDNDNDGNFSVRICWILEGGNYGWFGSPPFNKNDLAARAPPGTPFREHWHFRGHIPGHVPATLVTGFGSPCGMCFYEGDTLGKDFKNAPLHADSGPREVRIYPHLPGGYGMTASSTNLVTSAGDNYFRPDDVCTAPDGTVYISDWYDGGVGGHAYNDPDRGRIFVLRPTGKQPARSSKPGPYSNIPDSIEGLKSPNLATQYLARERLLAEGKKSLPALTALLSHAEPNFRARALWLLDRIGTQASRAEVVEQLKNSDAEFRALTVRILRRHGAEYATQILPLYGDASGQVRREVLLAAGKLPGDEALAVIARLAQKYDGRDRYELEALNIAAGDRKEQLFAILDGASGWSFQQLPLMQLLNPQAAAEFVTASLSKSGLDPKSASLLLEAAGNSASPEAANSLLGMIRNTSAPSDLRRLALDKLSANLPGSWKSLADDPKLLATMKSLLSEDSMQSPALAAIGIAGLASLGPEISALASSTKAEVAVRQQAIEVVARLRLKDASTTLRGLLNDGQEAVRQAASNALVDLQDLSALREMLANGKMPAKQQAEMTGRLMASTSGALVLLRLIEESRVSPELKQTVLAKAIVHPDANVRVLYEKFVPEAQRPQRLGSSIQADEILAMKGDAARGEKIFFQSSAAQCKNCHMVGGVGSSLGPDLSQIGKKYERRTLLETILDPSKAIAPEFIAYLMETEAGQVHAGFLVEKSDQQVVLRDIKNQLIRVPAREVVVLESQKKSLMPELILRDVTAQDAADLLAYLASLSSAVQHVGRFRVLGPFDAGRKGLDEDYGVEGSLAKPDLAAEHQGARGKKLRWEELSAENISGFPAIDQVKYSQSRGLPAEHVVFYYLVYADSPSDQKAELLIGSDDGNKAWVNGRQVHRNQARRAIGYAQDKVAVELKSGRNVIVLKVDNGDGAGGAALSLGSSIPVTLTTQ